MADNNGRPIIYVEHTITRAWNLELSDAQRVMGMPDATPEQLVAAISAAQSGEADWPSNEAEDFFETADDPSLYEDETHGRKVSTYQWGQ